MATAAEAAQNCDPLLSLAQSSSGQGGNRSVPKKEREIHGVDFRVVNWLFQLFLTHFEKTSDLFRTILGDIADVDARILQELDHGSKADEASKLHRQISMKLHVCSMELAELGRRTKSEEELATRLMEDLREHADLYLLITMFLGMSKSRKPGIEELPGKVEGLRNVVS